MIISKYIGEHDISPLIDWFTRDAESRGDLFIIISKEKTAKEILEACHTEGGLQSDKLMNALKNKEIVYQNILKQN